MKLPYLDESASTKKEVQIFRGYNHNPIIDDGEFFDMKNLSSSEFPLLSPRKPRGTVNVLVKPNGLTDKNGLLYVDGEDLYYNDEKIGTVADSKKQFVLMGAYVLIFPDKLCYNTSTDEIKNLEKHSVISTSIAITPCNLKGEFVDPDSSLYVKLSATGIGTGFNVYDGVVISNCNSADVNGNKILLVVNADYIIVAAKGVFPTTQSGTSLNIDRNVPDMDFLTESENRVWGCSSAKHEIYACKLGDPFNWYCYEGISTDSYAVTVGSDGNFTGAITYSGYVLFFKEDYVHKIYGNKPSNYQIITNAIRGVASGSEKSLAIVNETLYYMSRNGVMAYQGNIPEHISSVFGDKNYCDGVAGAWKDKYYISVKDGSKYHLFVYDVKMGIWHKEDNLHALYFTEYNNNLYYIDGYDNTLMTIEGSDDELITWFAEFTDYSEKTLNKKYVSKLQFRIEMADDSLFEAEIQYENSGIWEKVVSIVGKMRSSKTIPVKIRRCDYYKIRLTGIGQFKLYSMVKTITEGSER